MLRQLCFAIILVAGVILPDLPAAAQLPAETGAGTGTSTESEDRPEADLAKQIRRAVEDLHALRLKQRQTDDLQSNRAETIRRQIEQLQHSLRPVVEAAEAERQEIASLQATVSKQQNLAHRARNWINHAADAVHRPAVAAWERVRHGAGDEKLRRLTEIKKSIELLSDEAPLSQVEGIREFLRVLGDEWLPARSVTLTNRLVSTDGDRKRVHAWVVGFGLVAKVFVSEDGTQTGIWSGSPAAEWNRKLPEVARQQVRELIEVVREQRPPAVTPLPLEISPETTPPEEK